MHLLRDGSVNPKFLNLLTTMYNLYCDENIHYSFTADIYSHRYCEENFFVVLFNANSLQMVYISSQ